MKNRFTISTSQIVCFFTFCIQTALSQSYNFTWMNGPNLDDQGGVYGTMGVPATTNTPGSRCQYATWKDAAGNFWLFGGEGYITTSSSGLLNDLWKYNPTNNTWTWVNGNNTLNVNGVYGTMGVPSAANKPGARRYAAAWTDLAGNLWLYGGYGYAATGTSATGLGDLWKYDVSANQWTWVKGSNGANPPSVFGTQGTASASNDPGYRYNAAFWRDNNNDLWLFGGDGMASVTPTTSTLPSLCDLWKYSISSNQWTWVKGSSLYNQLGLYGTQGVPSNTTNPGVRRYAAFWTDNQGDLWLFGGDGASASSLNGYYLNDLWKYSVANNQWVWMKGSNSSQQIGTYGTMGVPASANTPGSRYGAFGWCDPSTGNFYMFGGQGYATSSQVILNDFWRFSPATNQWTWIKGSNAGNQTNVYGTQGVTLPTNMAASRIYFSGWLDAANNMWFLGGLALYALPLVEYYSDLWKIDNCIPPSVTISSSQPTLCPGQSATLTASGAATYSWSNTQTTSSIIIAPLNTVTVSVKGTSSVGCTQNQSFTQIVFPNPIVNSAPSNTSVCVGQSVTILASGANSYTWSNGQTGTIAVFSPSVASLVYAPTFSFTDNNNCIGTRTVTLIALAAPNLTVNSSASIVCSGETVTLTVSGASSYSWQTVSPAYTNTVSVTPNSTTTYTVFGAGFNNCTAPGVYTQAVDPCTQLLDHSGKLSEILVYPNPNSGTFFIEYSEPSLFELYNLQGQLISTTPLSGGTRQVFDFKLEKGLYYYSVTCGQKPDLKGKFLVE
jgi:N-acetylneuraminic acid mutarotase